MFTKGIEMKRGYFMMNNWWWQTNT